MRYAPEEILHVGHGRGGANAAFPLTFLLLRSNVLPQVERARQEAADRIAAAEVRVQVADKRRGRRRGRRTHNRAEWVSAFPVAWPDGEHRRRVLRLHAGWRRPRRAKRRRSHPSPSPSTSWRAADACPRLPRWPAPCSAVSLASHVTLVTSAPRAPAPAGRAEGGPRENTGPRVGRGPRTSGAARRGRGSRSPV